MENTKQQQNIKYTLSTGAIERVTPSKEAIRLCEELSKGKISADAAVASIKEKYGLLGCETSIQTSIFKESIMDFESVWQNIINCQGQTFYTRTNLKIEYEIKNNILYHNRADVPLTKETFRKAYAKLPLSGPSNLNMIGQSYIFAILTDYRISNFGKIKREIAENSNNKSSLEKKKIPSDTFDINKNIELCGYLFSFLQTIKPKCNKNNKIIEYAPQSEYENKDNLPLLYNGHGTFCKFEIQCNKIPAVYLWVLDGEIIYIGETLNLNQRFNQGYGNIYSRNCFKGGQSTNCKMNKIVLNTYKQGKQIDIYFYETSDYKNVELTLLKQIKTKYNVKDN